MGDANVLDEASLTREYRLVGLKRYVTDAPAELTPAAEFIANYHYLWHGEQAFWMSKTDLAAWPVFHHQRDSIEAHLAVVFIALGLAHHLQNATRFSIRRIVQTLRPLQQITVRIADHELTAVESSTPPT